MFVKCTTIYAHHQFRRIDTYGLQYRLAGDKKCVDSLAINNDKKS